MSTHELIKGIKEYAREYSYNTYGDYSREDIILRNELKNIGIINGDDEMVWKSPSQDLYFEVSREYSSLKTGTESGYQYICTITIKNELRMPISKIVFSELDAIRILEGFIEFTNPMWEYSNNIVWIDINPSSSLEKYTIELSEIQIEDLPPTLIFKINKYHTIYQTVAPVVTMNLTFEQLNDLAFHLFFALLIDIDIPVEYDEIMYKIEDYVTTENYWVYCKRRQKLLQLQQNKPEISNYVQSYMNYNEHVIQELPMNNVIMNPVVQQEQPTAVIPKVKKSKLRIKPISSPRSNIKNVT